MTSRLGYRTTPVLTSATTTNDTYGHYTTFSSSHLPEPPRTLKNRYLDTERDRIATSNETYGKYWKSMPRSDPDDAVSPGVGEDRPAGLDSHSVRRDEQTTKRMPFKHRSSESADAFWNKSEAASVHHPLAGPAGAPSGFADRPEYPWNAAGGAQSSNAEQFPTESDWPYGRNISQLRPPLPPISSDFGTGSSSTSRLLQPNFNDGGRSSSSNSLDGARYRVSVGLNGGFAASDIRGIDLQLRLNDNSTVTVRSVPFSYE